MTLGEVKTHFNGLLNNSVVRNNTALVSTFINQSIMRLQRELRVPFMEKQILYTIPLDGSFTKLSIPGDLLELISISVDADEDGVLETDLRRVDTQTAARASQEVACPRFYSRRGGAWLLGPLPTPGSKVLITYYAEFAALENDAAENTVLKVAWDAVLYGALSAACDYLVDERASGYEARYMQITTGLQSQADSDELTADAVVRPAYDWGDE